MRPRNSICAFTLLLSMVGLLGFVLVLSGCPLDRKVSLLTDSGCLPLADAKAIPAEELVLDWQPNTVSVFHGPVCYNCGYVAEVNYQVHGGVITITEKDGPETLPAFCDCLFEYTYDLRNIQPGDYLLVLQSEFMGTPPVVHFEENITLPAGQATSYTFSYQPVGECI